MVLTTLAKQESKYPKLPNKGRDKAHSLPFDDTRSVALVDAGRLQEHVQALLVLRQRMTCNPRGW